MKNKEEKGVVSGTFTWRIEGFSKLKGDRHYSEDFVIGGHKWRILIWPNGHIVNLVKHLSMYLSVADASALPFGWTTYARFSLVVANQLDSNKSRTKTVKGCFGQEFKENKTEWGFTSFMPLSELYDCSAGYLVNEVCIIKAKVDVPIKNEYQETDVSEITEPSNKQYQGQEPSNVNSLQSPDSSAAPNAPCSVLMLPFQDAPGSEKVCIKPTGDSPADPSLIKQLGEVPTTLTGELMDFRGLGKIEKAFVPLLDKVCLSHPSLIECQQKKSRLFNECAFTALGRLLHFLKTTKVKDMTLDACERLELFWGELESFKFDLAWLEPHVESAFCKTKFVQRAGRMKRLREDVEVLENETKRWMEDVDALENEIKRRRDTLAVAQVDFELAKRNLAMVKEDFNEIDMDSVLGYQRV